MKIAVIVLVVLLLLLGLPLGMPMSGASMCPECSAIGGWALMCVALIGAMVLATPRRTGGALIDRLRAPLPVEVDAIERPPRAS